MSDLDPPRLSSLGDQSELGELMRSAHDALPSDDVVARLAAKLGVLPPGGPGGGGGPSHPAPPPPAPVAAAPVAAVSAKVIAVAAFAAGAGIAAWVSFGPRSEPAPAPQKPVPVVVAPQETPAPLPVPVTPPEAPAPVEALPARPALPVNRNVKPAEKPPPAAPPAVPVVAPTELELIGQARRMVRADPSRAYALVSEHQKLYPRGTLAQEREVIAIEALSAMGKLDAARSRAKAFDAASPGSPYAERINRAIKKADADEH